MLSTVLPKGAQQHTFPIQELSTSLTPPFSMGRILNLT
jgi:hypothetical protein